MIIEMEGKVLKKVDGRMLITGVTTKDIKKVSSGNAIPAPGYSAAFNIGEPCEI